MSMIEVDPAVESREMAVSDWDVLVRALDPDGLASRLRIYTTAS